MGEARRSPCCLGRLKRAYLSFVVNHCYYKEVKEGWRACCIESSRLEGGQENEEEEEDEGGRGLTAISQEVDEWPTG